MPSLFAYIWKNSRREQLVILAIVLASFPFYFASLDLPRLIVSDAIQGRAFAGGKETAHLFDYTFSLPGWLGGWSVKLFDGYDFERMDYLLVLSGVFLVLVLINGAFKYVINIRKGALGERLLQHLRFELFARLLSFPPEALRHVKPSEAATIIKDEVEPIGGFVGDAFIAPVFLGGQALTALIFIIVQSPSLGFLAAFVVLIQAVVIPRLRREQLRLAKERQLKSRALAGKIGEVVDGIGEVATHGTSAFERAGVAQRLETLFSIRYLLYKRKFAVKFLNNLLAQLTPFMFYTIGGYYALRGYLEIGQLVAVIAAYRDLPPPIKELIDWDQQRLDVEVKFRQVVEQFSSGEIEPQDGGASPKEPPVGEIAVQNLKVVSAAGDLLLDGISTTLPAGAHVLLEERGGDGARTLGAVLGRRITQFDGTVRIAGVDLADLSNEIAGQTFAYAGLETAIFEGSLRANILYGLNRAPPTLDSRATLEPPWVDYAAAGATGPGDIDARLIEVVGIVGLSDSVFRFGLSSRIDPARNPEIAAQVVELRRRLRSRLGSMVGEGGPLVEPLDPARYSQNASIGDNILFGVALGEAFAGENLASQPFLRSVLASVGLEARLAELGRRIAVTMLDIFEDLSPDNFLFEQFAFIAATDFPLYREILARAAGGTLSPDDVRLLLCLALVYVEPRHRLGLLDDELRALILTARAAFRERATPEVRKCVEFYDPDLYCAAAPLRDNLLFGHIAIATAAAGERVVGLLRQMILELGLENEVYRLGLDQPAGYGGRLLFPAQKTALSLARCLIKRPRLLILNEALGPLGDTEARAVLAAIRAAMAGRMLVAVERQIGNDEDFDLRIAFNAGRIAATTGRMSGQATEAAEAPAPRLDPAVAAEREELRALRAVPLFAEVDIAHLKLLAFTSDRQVFAPGEVLFRQGDNSDSTYILVSGAADIIIDTPNGPLKVSSVGANGIVGEMGIITGDPRSATVKATEEVVALHVRKDVFLALMTEFPQMGLAVTRLMVRRLQENAAKAAGSR
ncbi:cyclic nucleotide-binding domain-containing protein [Ancylobacter terrae]|uniref:cyclic nucleotide-binding domain-containing protein n=1 Tax=Ancylobacter sp. sgz301288 TaxID=3342077 RepID=UPI00385E6636